MHHTVLTRTEMRARQTSAPQESCKCRSACIGEGGSIAEASEATCTNNVADEKQIIKSSLPGLMKKNYEAGRRQVFIIVN